MAEAAATTLSTTPKVHRNKVHSSKLTEDDLQVAQILVQLHRLFLNFKSLPLPWGHKKRRSALVAAPSSAPSPSLSQSPSPSPSPPRNDERALSKAHASSPATPLSFSPSDTDSKSRLSKTKHAPFTKKKKTNKQLKEMLSELSSRNDLLKHEVSKVKVYYEKLRTFNLRLKYRQLQLGLLQSRGLLDLNSCQSLVFEEPKDHPNPFIEKEYPISHHLSENSNEGKVVNATAAIGNFRYPCIELSALSESGLNLQSKHHSYRLLEMNFFADEAVNKDFPCKATIAAQARKRRLKLNRAKSSIAFKQPRLK